MSTSDHKKYTVMATRTGWVPVDHVEVHGLLLTSVRGTVINDLSEIIGWEMTPEPTKSGATARSNVGKAVKVYFGYKKMEFLDGTPWHRFWVEDLA